MAQPVFHSFEHLREAIENEWQKAKAPHSGNNIVGLGYVDWDCLSWTAWKLFPAL
jgi:hypothetical protein